MKTTISIFTLVTVAALGHAAAASAGVGYNGQCPKLAGQYTNDSDQSPMVFTQNVNDDGIVVYGYGSYGPDETMIADGKPHVIEGATVVVSCAQGILVKSYNTDGYQGQMTFRQRQDGGLVIQNKGMVNTSDSYSLNKK